MSVDPKFVELAADAVGPTIVEKFGRLFLAIILVVLRIQKYYIRNKGRPLWLLIFGKWFYLELARLVFPFAFIFENLARTLSPATLGHRLCCCLCCCAAAVLLLCRCCGGFHGGAAAVAFV